MFTGVYLYMNKLLATLFVVVYPLLMSFIPRDKELKSIERFARMSGAGFTFVRGRRRVGKTWLLKEYEASNPNCFYFMGIDDTDDAGSRKSFSVNWSHFSGDRSLLELSSEYRSWQRIFKEISNFLKSNTDKQLFLVLDEVQWIAKKNSGFVSLLKQAWVDWQRIGNIKVVLCGSSNKFFAKKTSGAQDVLRGIKTSASIWVEEFSLSEVEKYYLSTWSRPEICLTYMMLGGSPYYLESLDPEKGFVHAINDAVFTNRSIFLDEVNQVLKLEFNSTGLETSKRILSVIGQKGSSISTISKKLNMPISSVLSAINSLVEYGILFLKVPFDKSSKTSHSSQRRALYCMRDFYLNFYFQVLHSFVDIIKHNQDQLIFTSKSLLSNQGYYMPNFSGKGFELLVERVLRKKGLDIPIKTKLQLKTPAYTVGTYWDKSTEIDLLVDDPNDRILRLIECKWVGLDSKFSQHKKELQMKRYPQVANYSMKKYLLAAYAASEKQRKLAEDDGVMVLSLDDLF